MPEKKGSKGKKIVAIILAGILAFGAILFVMANGIVGKFTKRRIEKMTDERIKEMKDFCISLGIM